MPTVCDKSAKVFERDDLCLTNTEKQDRSPALKAYHEGVYCRLELVNDTHGRLVVSGDTSRFGVIVVVQLVEFIRSVDVHVLVKVVPGTHFDVFNQIRIAAGEASTRLQVLAFGLYVADGRTQAEVKLILYNCFKVLSFTSEVVESCCKSGST